jgi:hypothetical protein
MEHAEEAMNVGKSSCGRSIQWVRSMRKQKIKLYI